MVLFSSLFTFFFLIAMGRSSPRPQFHFWGATSSSMNLLKRSQITVPAVPASLFDRLAGSQAKSTKQGCPRQKVTKDLQVTQNEIRQLRLELIKVQFLARMNMTSPPKLPFRKRRLPTLVQEGRVPEASLDHVPLEPHTSPIIIVADSKIACWNGKQTWSSCFKFHLNLQETYDGEATLWFWKHSGHNSSITITQALFNETSKSTDRETFLSELAANVTHGWVSVNIVLSKAFLQDDDRPLYIKFSCSNCSGLRHRYPVSRKHSRMPFFVSKDSSSNSYGQIRKRRSSTKQCNTATNSEPCCLDSLYVTFEELKWQNWIIHPSGFHFYYCKGSCNDYSIESIQEEGITYSAMMQRILMRPDLSPQLIEALTPCCSAGRKQTLSVLLNIPNKKRSDHSPAITVRHLHHMIVESCHCFD